MFTISATNISNILDVNITSHYARVEHINGNLCTTVHCYRSIWYPKIYLYRSKLSLEPFYCVMTSSNGLRGRLPAHFNLRLLGNRISNNELSS